MQAELATAEAAIASQQLAFSRTAQVLRLQATWPEGQQLPETGPQVRLQWEEGSPLFARHPAVTALYQKVRAMQALEQQSKLAGRPQWQAGVDYVVTAPGPDSSVPNNGRNAIAPTLSLSIPLYGKKYKAGREAALARSRAAEEEQAALLNELEQRWVTAREAYEQAAADHELASSQIERFAQIIKLSEAALANASGEIGRATSRERK